MASKLTRTASLRPLAYLCALSFSAAAFTVAPGSAAADAPELETRTLAREFAMQGAESLEQKDFATALDRFHRAYTLYPAPSLSVMEARCLVGLGRWLEALGKYEQTAHASLSPDAPDAFRVAVRDAQREGDDLRARIPRLEIRIQANPEQLAKLKLKIDGRPVPGVLFNIERPIDPGAHTLEGVQPSGVPIHIVVDLSEHDRRLLEVVLDTGGPRQLLTTKTEGPASSSPLLNRRFFGWSSLGLGAVALSVGAFTGASALHRKSELDAACHPGCPRTQSGNIDGFRRERTISYISFGVGAAAIAAGGVLLLGAPGERPLLGLDLGWKRVGIRAWF